MNGATDQQLLREYAERHAEGAFNELVRRHLDLVYSAALRLARDPHLAQDVSQNVFVALAQNAGELSNRPVLAGWLHGTTRNLTANAIRSEVRRRAREALAMNELSSAENAPAWEQIEPHLDTALTELNEAERDAVLLRYFQKKSAREIAETLGISDEAAQKRVSRAVEKLREIFARRGIMVGSAGLVALISAHAVQAAPVGLGLVIGSAVAAAPSGAIIASTLATQTAVTLMNLKSIAAIIVAAGVAATGTYFVQRKEISRLRAEQQALASSQEKLAAEREAALAQAKAKEDELARLRTDQSELLKLRAQANKRLQAVVTKAVPTQTSPNNNAAAPGAFPPGTYITKEALAPVGYATPEAGLQTVMWAMMAGTYEQANEGLGPDQLAAELSDPKGKENFETGREKAVSLFKGLQILAKKQISEDRVEFKIKYDSDEAMKQAAPKLSDYVVQRMIKVGDQWKLGGSTRGYKPEWDQEGQVETFVQ